MTSKMMLNQPVKLKNYKINISKDSDLFLILYYIQISFYKNIIKIFLNNFKDIFKKLINFIK